MPCTFRLEHDIEVQQAARIIAHQHIDLKSQGNKKPRQTAGVI